jgi:hypothetical protein
VSWASESGFSASELRTLQALKTPARIQSFLNELGANFEENGDTCYSPRTVLREGRAHCVEGAVLGAAALRLQGRPATILELLTTADDDPHVIAVFRDENCWGAVGKTNHAVLRYRDAVYRTLRELVMSFFHEYFLNVNGAKTLRSYTRPMNLARFDSRGWPISERDIDYIPRQLERARHYELLSDSQVSRLRPADDIEVQAGKLVVERPPSSN